ncbi:MAG TPA: IPT/TIG domain-containing protein [Acidisarcina sp.]
MLIGLIAVAMMALPGFGGGPRWVAGQSYFDPAAMGKPVVWATGIVTYYTDLGGLSPTVNHAQADAMVAAAAGYWSGVPTAAVSIVFAGNLAEDVNGSNFAAAAGVATAPLDITNLQSQLPMAVVYDADGAVTDALVGAGSSDPSSCLTGGVTVVVDGMATDATITHVLMVVNGLCAVPAKMAMLQYQITRGFGVALGLGWSQTHDGIFNGSETWSAGAQASWPLMHPIERLCNSSGGTCMPGALGLRPDDVAVLGRLYPVTATNADIFPGKVVTAASTVSIHGVIQFRAGQGMQGVNVVVQPLLPGTTQPDARYTATAVSGALFAGNAGNPVNGYADALGNPLNQFGSTDQTLEGAYDLSGMVLPAGTTQADYQITFEAINPLDTGAEAVGPYTLGQAKPSGTMPVLIVRGLQAGANVVEDVTIEDSSQQLGWGADGAEASPANLPGNGEWVAKLDGYGNSSWFRWHIRAGRQLSIETQALDEQGRPTADKARPVLGIWQGTDAPLVRPARPAVQTLQPFNGIAAGLTTTWVQSAVDLDLRLGVADQRGDGRPDYLYRGRVLYADSVTPQRVPFGGAPVTIRGVGFRPQNIVTVNGVAAAVTGLTSTEISVIVPVAAAGVKGSVDLTVTDPATQGFTTILGGMSYDAGNTDGLSIVTAPSNVVPKDVPLPFAVKTLAADGVTPAGLLTVTYSVISGTAALGCGQLSCVVVSSGDGLATMAVIATSSTAAVVSASLSNGASVQASFSGGQVPQLAALAGTLYLAQGATFAWVPTALVLSNGMPSAGRAVNWGAGSGVGVSAAVTVSDAQGIATGSVVAGPLAPGASVAVNACLAGGAPNCAAFTVVSVDPAIAGLVAVGGTMQSLSATGGPALAMLRVEDAAGHPMAGGTVGFYETLRGWQPPCPLHGRCPAAPVLATQMVQATSGADGLVSLTPLSLPGTATMLDVVAVTGGNTTLDFQIEQHP